MVMVRSSGPVVEKEGKQGNEIWWTDQCGQHKRGRGIRPGGGFRKPSRSQAAFVKAKNAWIEHQWTEVEIKAWWYFCYWFPHTNRKGETYYWHPFLAFMHVNIYQCMNELPIKYLPPLVW